MQEIFKTTKHTKKIFKQSLHIKKKQTEIRLMALPQKLLQVTLKTK